MPENQDNSRPTQKNDTKGFSRLLAKPGMQAVLFAAALIYIISPVDAVPDVVPLMGWLDDGAVFIAELINFLVYVKKKRQELNPGSKE